MIKQNKIKSYLSEVDDDGEEMKVRSEERIYREKEWKQQFESEITPPPPGDT